MREAALNIRRFKALWSRSARLEARGLGRLMERRDAMGVMELLADEEEGGGGGIASGGGEGEGEGEEAAT